MGKTVYSFEVRLDAVQRHLGGISLKALAEEIHCSAGDIQKWRDAYLEHGPDALKPIEHFEHYSSDFKISVIEYMHSTGSSIRKTAAHFNISSFSSVMRWEKLYNEQGNDAFLSGKVLSRFYETNNKAVENAKKLYAGKTLDTLSQNGALCGEVFDIIMDM